jgi:N-acetylneuraminic acid mutarotase
MTFRIKHIRNFLKRSSLLLGLALAVPFLLAPSVLAAAAGNTEPWSTSTNALPVGTTNNTSVTYNGYVYVIGGYTNGGISDTTYYAQLNSDGTVGTWNTSPSVLPQAVATATSVVYNGYVYVIGGRNTNNYTNTVYYAKLNSDGTVGTWNTSASTLPQVDATATSVTYNGYVYVMGGYAGGIGGHYDLDAVYYAKLNSDGTVGTWNTSPSVLPQAAHYATAISDNGYAYVMGGSTFSGTALDAVYYAKLNSDGTVGTWNTSPSVLPQATDSATAVLNDDYVYIMGGENSSGRTNAIYYAKLNSDGTVGTWNTNTNNLPQGAPGANAVAYNGYLYVLGGSYFDISTFSSTYFDSVYYTHITPVIQTLTNSVPITTANTSTSASPAAPDTGFGMPNKDIPVVKGLMIGATVSIATGLALLYTRSKAKTSPNL